MVDKKDGLTALAVSPLSGVVYCKTWEGEGSRTSRRAAEYSAAGTALARLLQTGGGVFRRASISESETAFPVTHDQQNARTTQHRPCAAHRLDLARQTPRQYQTGE